MIEPEAKAQARILIVDDEPFNIEILTEHLQKGGRVPRLMLKPGEFFALQVNAWRHRHHAVHGGMLPAAHWSALDLIGLYKRVRAVSAKRRDDAKSIEEARHYFRQKYQPHRELLRRTYRKETVH